MIPQWGRLYAYGHGFKWVTFPVVYPNRILNVTQTYKWNGAGDVSDSRGMYGETNSGFYCSHDANDSNAGAYWKAYGY